jgi:hypothetical protein
MMDSKHYTDHDISDDEIRIIGFDDNEPDKDSEADIDGRNYDYSMEPETPSKSMELQRFYMPLDTFRADESARNHSLKLLDKSRRLKIRFRYAVIIFSVLTLALVIAVGTLIYSLNYNKNLYLEADGTFESTSTFCVSGDTAITDATPLSVIRESAEHVADSAGFVEITDMTVNDVAMRLYIPHNAEMSLHLGPIDFDDTSIIYAAQAADVRADNGGIVGAFVLNGEPKAWGLSKKGYVASINGEVTVGVADNSPLFEKATECQGHFFRQYPLVSNGQMVPNKIRGKSIRRGICQRNDEIFMVETMNKESFHDFSLALVDLGVDQAVYLVGSTAAGWAVDANDSIHTFGDRNRYNNKKPMPKNISYIVWRRL